MENIDQFISEVKNSGSSFISTLKPNTKISLIGHHDTDGLCSIAMLEKALERESLSFETANIPQLEDEFLEKISKEADVFIFADIGSANLELIQKHFPKKEVIILDHHKPNTEKVSKNISLLNPFLYGIDEEKIISGAGVVYFFCQGMNPQNKELAQLAVLGAIGDTQEDDGFKDLNNIILQHSILQKQISVLRELRLYGKNSRPLLKVLQYSTDLQIPGITNDYQGTLKFFRELRIPLNWKGKPRKWYNLREDEKNLITEKILELKGEENQEEFTVNNYKFNLFKRRELSCGREFATIVNASGRLEDYRTAIDALKGNEDAQAKIVFNLRTYKFSIKEGLDLFEKYKEAGQIINNGKVVVFDTEDKLKPNIVGVIASIIARNKYYDEGIIICTLSNIPDQKIKISLRVSRDKSEMNLADLLQKTVSPWSLPAGGHTNAAGAIIPSEKKEEFIQNLISNIL